MSKLLVKVSLLGLFVAGIVNATEFRSPWLSERGPIRYIFEKDNPDRYSLNIYALAQRREAHKAFMKHGTDTQPLTTLFFNKSDFKIEESFPNAQLNPNAKYYNPYLALSTIRPRATYYEWGVNLGARFEYPVWRDKGRIGLRTNIPFRNIEIEREDITSSSDNPEDEFILSRYSKVGNYRPVDEDENPPYYGEAIDILSKAYSLDLISKLFQDNARTPALQFADGSAKVFGIEIAKDFHTANGRFKSTVKQPVAGVIKNSGTGSPNEPNFNEWNYVSTTVDTVPATNGDDIENVPADSGGYGIRVGGSHTLGSVDPIAVEERYNWAFDSGDDVVQGSGTPGVANNEKLQAHRILNNANNPMSSIARANEIMNSPNVYFFDNTTGGAAGTNMRYDEFNDASGYPTNMPTDLKEGWLVFGYDNGNLVPGATTIKDGIETSISQYNDDPYEWLYIHGPYEFETQRRTGLGDIDLDFFYEHRFSNEWIAELMVGVRFPTGAGDDYSENPYRVHLGNGEHWEIKLGGMADWQAINWMNIKLDTYVSFVIEGTEKRCAVFEGSTVKNIGPKVDADVDWIYFVARLDATLFHPKTNDISATIGYEFYYKTEDNLHFKQTQMTPFYGPDYSDPSDLLLANLSNKLAEANTEAIGHKLRGEVRIQVNEWFEIVGASAFTFAGKNLAREWDMHGGFNVKF